MSEVQGILMKIKPIIAFMILLTSHQGIGPKEPVYLTTETPITILSANDGEIRATDENKPGDSITVIHLRPDNPPVVKTKYGTVPNSIVGSPHMAIAANGRYGFVVHHPWSASFWWPNRNNPDVLKSHSSEGQLSVIDLNSSDLPVINTIMLSGCPTMAVTLPDDERIIVGGMESFFMFRVVNNSVTKVSSISTTVDVSSFDVCSKGKTIIASGEDGIHLYEIVRNNIKYCHSIESANDDISIEKPFSLRIAPSDECAIVLNGGGINQKGTLDDALIIDLTLDKPKVVNSISELADGAPTHGFSVRCSCLLVAGKGVSLIYGLESR
jgi:hypothetical protein